MRVFIVSTQKFPRGDAGANYIQYLALALMDAGMDVIVIGCKVGNTKLENGNYKGIQYCVGPIPNSWERGVFYPKKFYQKVANIFNINKSDYILSYASNYNTLIFFSKKVNGRHVFLIRVEDMQPMQYKYGRYNLNYIFLQKAIRFACKRCAGTLAISKKIYEKDKKRGGQSMVLPILADPYEYEINIDKDKGNPIELIYPGLKVNRLEDDVETIFKAIANLSIEYRNKLKLNITGMDENKIKSVMDKKTYELIKDNLVIHGFLDYRDLACLYQKMDFLVLPRKNNAITEANFPSKIPELMSYGVIPICTEVGDYTANYLSSETALIVCDSSVFNYRTALEKVVLMDDFEYKKMRQAARKLVEEKLYYKLWGKKILDFICASSEEK